MIIITGKTPQILKLYEITLFSTGSSDYYPHYDDA